MAALNKFHTGVILLTPSGESQTPPPAAEAYWQNQIDRGGQLVFPVLIKDIIDDEKARSNTNWTADHIAALATAEITGLPCRRCGRTLQPLPVHSRKDARALWKDQRLPNRSQAAVCSHCVDEVSSWLSARTKDLPHELGLGDLLHSQSLTNSRVFAAQMKGDDMAADLGFPALNRLALTVLVPVAADHWDAIEPGGVNADFFPARMTWEFAGLTGTATERKKSFESLVASLMSSPAIFAEDLVSTARSCIENEVLSYIDHNLQERKWAPFDEAQVARVRATVAANWGPLNLGVMYNVVWSAFRATADLTSYRTSMGNQSRSGYIVNQITRGAEKVLAGEWDRREYDQPPKLPYRPDSLALFRTLLDLDIRTATPDDVEALHVPMPTPDDASILRHIRAIVTSRQVSIGLERSSIFEAFLGVYSTHLYQQAEQHAFSAAITGLAYLHGYANPSVLEYIRYELEEIREVAVIRAEREALAQHTN